MMLEWLDGAIRSVAFALMVWSGLRVLRVRNVLALKCAWILVLLAAFLAPFAVRWPLVTVAFPVLVPGRPINGVESPARTMEWNAAGPAQASPRAGADVRNQELAGHALGREPKEPSGAQLAIPEPNAGRFSLLPVPQLASARFSPVQLRSYAPGQIAAFVYVAVATILLFRLLYGLVAALRLWWRAEPVPAPTARLLEGLRARTSLALSSPVAIGSAVLLPASHSEWDEEKLRVVLAHERSHVLQGDFYLQTLAGLYAALVWFSPLGWWLKRRLSELGEAISDRSGLREAASRSTYAQILLEFAAAPRPTSIGVAMASSSKLSDRIERLVDDSTFRQAYTFSRRTVCTAVLVTVAMFAATTLVRVEAASQAVPPAANSPAPKRATRVHPAPAPAPHPATVPHIVIPPVHVNVPAQHIDVPAVHVDVPAVHVNVPAQRIDVPAVHVNIPAHAIDVPAEKIDVPAIHMDEPAKHIDVPPIHLNLPTGASIEDGHASLSVPAVLLAMLHGAPHLPRVVRASTSNEASFERTLTFTGSPILHISNGSGNIHIAPGPTGQVHVSARIYARNASDAELVRSIAAHPPIEQNGNTIRIGGSPSTNHISIDYEISAPADTALTAISGSGNVTDEGVGRDAKLETGSGNITATAMVSAFKAETGSGNIVVENTGDASVETGSGKIDLQAVHGALTAETGSGEIHAQGTPTAAWKLEAGSGDIELAAGNAPITLDASTGSGSISSEGAMTTQVTENRHRLRAALNGGGTNVRIETGSGNIRIR